MSTRRKRPYSRRPYTFKYDILEIEVWKDVSWGKSGKLVKVLRTKEEIREFLRENPDFRPLIRERLEDDPPGIHTLSFYDPVTDMGWVVKVRKRVVYRGRTVA